MNDFTSNLIEKLGSLSAQEILQSETDGAYFHALSPLSLNVIEWFPFKREDRVLQVGAADGVYCLLAERVTSWDIFDPDKEQLDLVKVRLKKNAYVGPEQEEKIEEPQKNDSTEKADTTQKEDTPQKEPYRNISLFSDPAECMKKEAGYTVLFIASWPGSEKAAELVKKTACSEVIVLAENAEALKFASGNQKEEGVCYVRSEEISAFADSINNTGNGNDAGNIIRKEQKMFYPLPGSRITKEIFSDALLPGPGDFRGIGFGYKEGEAAACDLESLYTTLLGKNRSLFTLFAPAFLLCVTSRDLPDYIRYNRSRKSCYQTRTEVRAGKSVVKTALCPQADEHIRALAVNPGILRNEMPEEIGISEPVISVNEAGRAQAAFPYIQGQSLGRKLAAGIRDGKAPEEEISKILKMLNISTTVENTDNNKNKYDSIKKNIDSKSGLSKPQTEGQAADSELAGTPADIPVAEKGQVKLQTEPAAFEGNSAEYRHNLDALFENFMEDEAGKLTLIDHEWTMKEPVPADFVRYRILRYFYEENSEQLYGYAGLPGFLASFGISAQDAARFEKLEDDFQNTVYGDGGARLENRYRKESTSAAEVRESARQMAADEIEELKTTLKKERETERLSQQHIRNIENINKIREQELEILRNEVQILRRNQSLLSKVKRALIKKLDTFAPADSGKRIVIKYIKGTIRHPLVYIKRYLTTEGHTYIRGSFAIRGEFSEGGILSIPQPLPETNPLVSIIIPAYNQVQYTYACIRSVIEHTDAASTPYEIILADDASTDATGRLTDWVKGLIVSRTGGNLGFLKNCNEAAAKARGEYIFFLNNDTKVTDGWLSSLVALMEKDASIGMCGSKLIYPDGRLQEAGGIIWSDASGWNYGRMDDPGKCQYNYVREVDYISGAAILIRTALWKEIGGFDERYAPAYCEDSDLAFEVRRHGKKVVLQPQSVVIHFEGVSNGTDVNGTGLKHYQLENQQKFRQKWEKELKEQSVNTGDPNPFAARERSQKKKTILIIDHYVPRWDKDAGSKTTFQYIQMFLKKGYNVKFLGDNFEKDQPYTGVLEQMGVEVLYGEQMREEIFDWIEKNKDFIDIAYLNRPHITVKYLDFLRDHTKIKCIYYGHDLHYLRLHREYELTGNIRKRREAEYWKGLEYQVMERADMVYYPSQSEIDEIHLRRPQIPAKAIVAYIYDKETEGSGSTFEAGNTPDKARTVRTAAQPRTEQRTKQRTEQLKETVAASKGFLFVGGFAHQPNEDGVLWFAEKIWPGIRKELPEAEFFVAGSHPTEKIMALDGTDGIHVLGFVPDETLDELYRECRIVVVPLRYGAGVKGKVIEALAKDAAIITTSVGAEGIPEPGAVMEVTDAPAAFAKTAVSLYQDENRLAQMKAADAPFIAKNYSTQAAWSVIGDDF